MPDRIDWDAVRSRLAAVEAALGHAELSDDQREAIFARRAEALAAPSTSAEPADAFQALVFSLGDAWYAVPSWQVREVRTLGQLTPLPGAPTFIAGLVNVRGRVVPALDLAPLFGLPATDETPQAIMLLSGSRGDVAVLTSEQPTLRWLQDGDLGPLPPGGPSGLDPTAVRGVTPDLVIVLDGVRLLADQRLLVQDMLK
jgi:purine-binding chemotaxis protein CheW